MRLGPAELDHLRSDLESLVGDGVLDRSIMRCDVKPEKFAGGLDERLLKSLSFFNTQGQLVEFLRNIVAVNPGARPLVGDWLQRIAQAGAGAVQRPLQPAQDLRLTGSQRRILREAIQASFDHQKFAIFLLEQLDKTLANYAGADPFDVTVGNAIDGASREGWLDSLLKELAKAYPHRKEFVDLADALAISLKDF